MKNRKKSMRLVASVIVAIAAALVCLAGCAGGSGVVGTWYHVDVDDGKMEFVTFDKNGTWIDDSGNTGNWTETDSSVSMTGGWVNEALQKGDGTLTTMGDDARTLVKEQAKAQETYDALVDAANAQRDELAKTIKGNLIGSYAYKSVLREEQQVSVSFKEDGTWTCECRYEMTDVFGKSLGKTYDGAANGTWRIAYEPKCEASYAPDDLKVQVDDGNQTGADPISKPEVVVNSYDKDEISEVILHQNGSLLVKL